MEKNTTIKFSKEERETLVKAAKIIRKFKKALRLIDADALAEKKFQERECNGLGEGSAYRQGWNDAIDAIIDNEMLDSLVYPDELFLDRFN